MLCLIPALAAGPLLPLEVGAGQLLSGRCSICCASAGPGASSSEVPAAEFRFSVAHLDRAVDPAEDFYRFAAGTWLRETQIPADKARWSAFDELQDRTHRQLRSLLEGLGERGPEPGSPEQLAGDFYRSAMDAESIEQRGLEGVLPWLQRADSISNAEEALGLAADLRRLGFSAFFSFWVGPDAGQSTVNTVYLGQGGLGLPSRDYYESDAFAEIRHQYREHLERMFALLGDAPDVACLEAERVWDFESSLAASSRRPVELRDAVANYHRFELDRPAPDLGGFDLGGLLSRLGAPELEYVVVRQPEFLQALARELTVRPAEDLRAYLRWRVVSAAAPYLPRAFQEADFAFYGRVLSGAREMEPDWMRAVRATDSSVGDALSQLYVREHFPPAALARAGEMIGFIKDTFRDRLQRLEWMSPQTRGRAAEKFARFQAKIGHPAKWRDYAGLEVRPDTYLANVLAARRWEFDRRMQSAGQAVDPEDWGMTASTVNAYFSATRNEIVFPAAILQPPFFDLDLDDAVNYGAIGAVIAHEISHGFDDQGRRYDAAGNLADWWTSEDEARFQERSGRLVEQFDAYEVAPGLFANGRLSLGENIADLGGISIALEALQRSIEARGTPPPSIDGFSPEQRFFLSWAQVWRVHYRDEALRRQITVGPHAPGSLRAIGTPRNLDAFHQAFRIVEGNAMWLPPEERVAIW